MIFKNFCVYVCLILIGTISVGVTAQDKVDFVKDIKPILEKHCISCHGPEKEEAFRIDDQESTEYYLEPGSSDDSDLYQVLVSDDEDELMPPPDEGIPLTAEQIAVFKKWVDEGAQWPDDVELVDTSTQEPEPETEATPEAPANGEKPVDKKPVDKKVDKKSQQIFNAIGSLHPAAVHLPIGLLLASGLFALFSLRGNFVMSDCAYYCLWLGTIGAIVACATGWWFSPMENRGTVSTFADLFDQKHPVFWHRTGGLVVTAVAFLLALFAAGARNRDPDDGMLWKIGLILLAGGIGWVGHTGGELHYPSDHYEDLEAVFQGIIGGGEANDADPKAEKNDLPKNAEPQKDEGGDIGKVSDQATLISGELNSRVAGFVVNRCCSRRV